MTGSEPETNENETPAPSAFEAGLAAIRDALAHPDAVGTVTEADPFEVKLARYALNDTGNGERLRARYGKDLMFVRDIGWHAWVQTHWSAKDGERLAVILAQATAKQIMDEAAHLKAQLIEMADLGDPNGYLLGVGEPGRGQIEDKRIARLHAHAIKSGDIGKSNAMLEAAKPHLTVTIDQLDADPFLFNVTNGTLHLKAIGPDGRHVVKKKHNRADRITKLSPAVYDPKARCPEFDRFLATIQPPKPEDDGRAVIADFLQTFSGYSMTADVGERKMVMALGERGNNGKSTFIGAIAEVHGDYAMSIPVQTLLEGDFAKSGGDASPDLARLPGARLVRTAEPKKGARLAEGLIKQLTGGTDVMTVRHLNKGFFDFIPTFKFFMSENTKPIISGGDAAIWNRIALVNFEVHIPEAEVDRKLSEKLKGELSGILNWMVEGFRDWMANGLVLPDAVKAAVEEYRGESDKVGNFISAAVLATKGRSVSAKRMFDAFLRWAKLSGEDPMSATAFGRAMGERGFKKEKIGTIFYIDCELTDDFQDSGAGALDEPAHEGDGR